MKKYFTIDMRTGEIIFAGCYKDCLTISMTNHWYRVR
jgi:hypothetical protein